jgi:hypothetical protein
MQELAFSKDITQERLHLSRFFKSRNNQVLFECILRIAYDQGGGCVRSAIGNLCTSLLIAENTFQQKLEGENVVWKIVHGLRSRYEGISALRYEGEPLEEFFIKNSNEYFCAITAVLAFISSVCNEREKIGQVVDHISANCAQTMNALPVVLSHTPAHLEKLSEIKAFFQRRKTLLDSIKMEIN